MTFAANDPSVRLVYSLNNTKLDPTLYPGERGKSRFAYVWPMQDVSLVADLAVGERATASVLADAELVRAEVARGRMVIPVGSRYVQELCKVTRGRKKNTTRNMGGCRFVSLIGKDAW